MYKYFISYYFNSEKQTGNGNCAIKLDNLITMKDIKEIQSEINSTRKDGYGEPITCIITNFILLSENV